MYYVGLQGLDMHCATHTESVSIWFVSTVKDADQARMEPVHVYDPFHVMGGREVWPLKGSDVIQ